MLCINTLLISSPSPSIDNQDLMEGQLYFNRGVLELDDDNGNLEAAKDYFSKAKKIFETHQAEDYLAKTLIRQAGVCFRTNCLRNAEIYLKDAEQLRTTKRTGISLALAKTKLERLKGNTDKALANALNAQKLATFLGNHQQLDRIQKLIKILKKDQSEEGLPTR